MIGFDNGSFRDLSEISIPITSLSINRGYGAFEFLEVINGKPFYGDLHVTRLQNSMNLLHLKTGFNDQLKEVLAALIAKNNLRNAFIKLFVLPHTAARNGWYEGALYAFPTTMPTYAESLYTHGARLVTKQYERFLPEAKSTNYLSGQFWMDTCPDERVMDILFHDGQTVQETSRGNIFVVKNGQVITPADRVLKGITRELVLDLLEQLALPAQERSIELLELTGVDEIFLTSTTKLVVPITTIDDWTVGDGTPGPITQQVMTQFELLRRQANER
ncbi:aminotransferase class IV [Sunxiuqinia elliptica]